jgi:RNA polymerase sigma factor (sigma-70 family)
MIGRARPFFAKLVAGCLDGEESAWDQLVEIISPIVLGICRSMGLSREEGLEVFGQTSFLLLTNLAKLRSGDKVVSYAATTARREALKLIGRARLLREIVDRELPIGARDGAKNPEEDLEEKQRQEILIRAVFKLPEKEGRLIWHLFLDKNEPSYEEISRKLKIPVSAIGPTRGRCLKKLRRILARMGYKF